MIYPPHIIGSTMKTEQQKQTDSILAIVEELKKLRKENQILKKLAVKSDVILSVLLERDLTIVPRSLSIDEKEYSLPTFAMSTPARGASALVSAEKVKQIYDTLTGLLGVKVSDIHAEIEKRLTTETEKGVNKNG